ncbi:MAG: GlsB/YeaQ/YmgE family stress response membrane protein [Gammaproteobacteria bacterium]
MNIIVWLVVGGLIGWVASVLMGTDGGQGIILNVIVGIVGAMLGGWFFSGVFGGGSTINQGDFSLYGLVVSLIGASVLLAVVKFARRV